MTLEFRVLGPVEVLANGEPIRLGGRMQRALLAILLLNVNEVVSSDRLIEALWDSGAPDTAAKALQVHVSQLRKTLEPQRERGDAAGVLVTKAPGYMLRIAPEQLDAAHFDRLAAEGRRMLDAGDPAGALARLGDALALWRGEALADLAYASFPQAEIGRLEELRLAAHEDRIEAHLACGREGEVVGELERFVAEHPLRERPRGQLMLALYRSGRQADALELYRDTREVLVEELGIEPGKALRDLQAAILAQDPSLDAPAADGAAPRPALDHRGRRAAATEFVGRQRELHDLEVALEGALMGRGCVFLIGGEPGIGKSRLADELGERARALDAEVLWGRCWEAGGAPAFWPWVQSLREYVRRVDAGRLRQLLGPEGGELAHLIPELREMLPDLPVLELPDSEGARFRLFDAAASFLKRAAAEQPLMLVLEDLHAADASSLLLLQFVAGEIASSRLLVVGTYRDIELAPGNPLAGALVELERQQATRTLPLTGFREDDVARLIETIAGVSPSRRVATAIHHATGGNPLFVGELVRLLVAEGRLEEPVSETGVRHAIPRGVREVIARRLAQVSDEGREVLGVAAVLGREFSFDTLVHVSGRSAEGVLSLLDEASEAGVVSETPGGAYWMRFSHVLIRDALYDGLGAARRVQLHRRIGETLAELHAADPDPHLAELAYHFFEAGPSGDPRKAFDYARKAGDRAARLLAYEEAVRLYELAIRVTESTGALGDHERCETLIALGHAQLRAGDDEGAKQTFLATAELARHLADPQALAESALGYGGRYLNMASRGDPHVIPLLEETLTALPPGDSTMRAKVMARLSCAIRDQPFRDRRVSLSEEAVEMARRTGDAHTLAYALDARCIAIDGPDTVAEFGATAQEAVRVGGEAQDPERVLWGRNYQVYFHLTLGDLVAAREELTSVTRLAEETREPALRWYSAGLIPALSLFEGRFDDAEELIRQAYELARDAVRFNPLASYCLQMLVLHRERGEPPYDEGPLRELAAKHPTYTILPCALAALLMDGGREDEAARLFEDLAHDDFGRIYMDEEWLASLTLLADVCWSLRDVDRASVLYRQLLPYRTLNAIGYPETILGSVERPLAVLASMTDQTGAADDHFKRALEMNARMGARPWVAHTQHDYARMLSTRGAPADRRRGHQLLMATCEAYRDLGMAPWVARVENELEASR